jgi:hypothetical protein
MAYEGRGLYFVDDHRTRLGRRPRRQHERHFQNDSEEDEEAH